MRILSFKVACNLLELMTLLLDGIVRAHIMDVHVAEYYTKGDRAIWAFYNNKDKSHHYVHIFYMYIVCIFQYNNANSSNEK